MDVADTGNDRLKYLNIVLKTLLKRLDLPYLARFTVLINMDMRLTVRLVWVLGRLRLGRDTMTT